MAVIITLLIIYIGSNLYITSDCIYYYVSSSKKNKILWETEEHKVRRKEIQERIGGDELWID